MDHIELNKKKLMGVRVCAEEWRDQPAPDAEVPAVLGRKEGVTPQKTCP